MSFFFFSPFLTAGALGALLVPLSVSLALPLGALDLPDGKRKRHARATPRLGGLGLYFAVLLALIPSLFSPSAKVIAAVLAGGAIVTALGISDDIAMVVGIVIGIFGGIIASLAYPIYNVIVKARRKEIAPEIIRLTDELMK